MRLEKVVIVLNLARSLASSAEGITLDEMASSVGVGRRTVERMRDAIEGVFGPLEVIDDGRKKRFRIAARGLGQFAIVPTTDELVELENAARSYEIVEDFNRASMLKSLSAKIRANLREGDRRRLATDVEALLRAEAFAQQVGPRPFADPHVFSLLRQSLLMQKVISFNYSADGSKKSKHKVVPYGLIFGARYYLVGRVKSKPDPVLFRIDRIKNVNIEDTFGSPPESFNLQEYSARSFGVFQEPAENIVLQFSKESAEDARIFLFHPSQSFVNQDDGTLLVSFRSGGILQIVHHLMTWGNAVSVVSPLRLKEMLAEEVEKLFVHHVSKEQIEGLLRKRKR